MPLNPTGSDQPGRLIKRSFSLAGHRTSVALETEFWDVLIDVARSRGVTLAELVAKVDAARREGAPLASSLRVLALRSVRDVTVRDHPAPLIGR
jgi:predicted DNA-binding ribbon-helix-helix protein